MKSWTWRTEEVKKKIEEKEKKAERRGIGRRKGKKRVEPKKDT